MNVDTFIPPSLAIAPRGRDEIANLSLRTVAIDCCHTFEVWSPKPKSVLTSYEAEFLRADRSRVGAICSKLVWLFGATCSESEEGWGDGTRRVRSWEEVLYFASSYQFRVDAIDVIFCPQTLRPIYSAQQRLESWVFEPANWEVFLLQLKPSNGNFTVKSRDIPLRIHLWTGTPVKYSATFTSSDNHPLEEV